MLSNREKKTAGKLFLYSTRRLDTMGLVPWRFIFVNKAKGTLIILKLKIGREIISYYFAKKY